MEILRQHGTEVTVGQAKLILEFLRKLAAIAVTQYLNTADLYIRVSTDEQADKEFSEVLYCNWTNKYPYVHQKQIPEWITFSSDSKDFLFVRLKGCLLRALNNKTCKNP